MTDALPTIADLTSRGALFVVSHSGGKDSQAMMIELQRRIPRRHLVVIHADLGDVEWSGARELAEQQARDAGVPFIAARAVKTFLEMVEHRFKVRPGPNSPCWPSAENRQCTSDLKRGPIEREARRFAKANGFSTVVTCMGIRAEESPARAKLPALRINRRNTIIDRAWFDWLPIFDRTTRQVFDTIHDAGQWAHEAYYEADNDRLSCLFCIFGSAKDIANGARRRPDMLARFVEVEQRTGYTMHMSRKPLLQLVAEGEALLARAAP